MIEYLENEQKKLLANKKVEIITEKATITENTIDPQLNSVLSRLSNVTSIVILILTISLLQTHPDVSKALMIFNTVLLLIQYVLEPKNSKFSALQNAFYNRDYKIAIISLIIPVSIILIASIVKEYDLGFWIKPSIAYSSIIPALLPLIKLKKKKQPLSMKTHKNDNIIDFRALKR